MCGQAVVGRGYLREEPDALMSARPGLCGGRRVTGVPTAIANRRGVLKLVSHVRPLRRLLGKKAR